MKTEPIIQKVVFKNTSPKVIYELYMDPKKHAALTGAPAKIQAKVGGKFSAYSGGLTGTILHLEKDKMIVQTWRSDAFKKTDVDSMLFIQLEAKGKDTILRMVHGNVPEQDYAGVTDGWPTYYWEPMKEHLKKKTTKKK
jgi:activator of HSP90 ATPase